MAHPLQSCKFLNVIRPAAIVDNAAFTTAEIDTLGYGHCTVICNLGATDVALTVLKMQESDTSGSGFTDITGLIFGTSNGIDGAASTLPSATDDNNLYVFQIPLVGRKRYLDLSATIGDGTVGGFLVAVAVLSEPKIAPLTVAEMGVGQALRIA